MPTIDQDPVKIGPWVFTPWPTLPLPSEAWLQEMGAQNGPAWLHEFHAMRERQIAEERHDPLTNGWEQPPLKVVRDLLAGTYVPGRFGVSMAPAGWKQERPANDVAGLGGNGSGKSEVQGKLAMEVLVGRANREARCWSQNEQTSVRYIQRALFKYLPPELRRVKKLGQVTKISYSEATGFSMGTFVLPNHSAGFFPTYKGWQQDRSSAEGGECHVLTWDEECPAELIETLRFRAHKTGGFVFGGFTPVEGYTATVAEYIEGATLLEVIPARAVVWDWWNRTWSWGEWMLPEDRVLVEGCPKGHVPFVMQSGAGGGRRFAVTFPTMFNPYTEVEEIVLSTEGKTVDHKLERLWGWATKKVHRAFPKFGEVHLVDPSRLPPARDMTLYWFADPHGNRNWFMLWLGVDADNRIWVLKEWPDVPRVGEWALPGSKPDGKPGPGQTSGSGKSFNDYKRLVLTEEGWAPAADGTWKPRDDAWLPSDRRLDPRPAGTSVPSDEEARTYLDHLCEPIRENGRVLVPGLDCVAAPHCGIEDGIQLINDWITGGWDPGEPVTPLNCPRFYVNRECRNLEWALRTYTGADGEKGACKDPIDCLKGAAKMGINYVPAGGLGTKRGWGGY